MTTKVLLFIIYSCTLVLASQERIVYYQSVTAPTETTFYLLSLPDSYSDVGPVLPVFIYFVGAGEWGTNPVKYSDVGPFFAIRNNTGNTRLDLGMGDMVFVAPNMPRQCNFNTDVWLAHEALRHVASQYRIDLNRVILSGVSTGALGIVQYISAFPGTVAAAAIISGPNRKGLTLPQDSDGCFPRPVAGPVSIPCTVFTRQVHLWLIHGQDDWAGFWIGPNYAVNLYNRLVNCRPAPWFIPQFSLVEQGMHGWDIWHEIFINIGNGTWGLVEPGLVSLQDMTIYQWAKQYSLQLPVLETLQNATADDQGNVNLLQQSRFPRVTASSFFVSRDPAMAFWPSNVGDGDQSTAWIPFNANYTSHSKMSLPPPSHFLLVDFQEIVELARVVVHRVEARQDDQPAGWKLTLYNATDSEGVDISRHIIQSTAKNHTTSWNLRAPIKASLFRIDFPVANPFSLQLADQNPRISEIEMWGVIPAKPHHNSTKMVSPMINWRDSSSQPLVPFSTYGTTVVTDEPTATRYEATPILDNLPVSFGFVGCYCDDFELGLPDGGSNCGERTSKGWAGPWYSHFEAVASPILLPVDPSVPWSHLQGQHYLRLPSVVENEWDCMVSRFFAVSAGVPLQVKFRMAIPRLSHEALANSVCLLRIETRFPKEMHYTEAAVVAFPQSSKDAVVSKTVHLGTPSISATMELQLSVLVSDHQQLYYNIDSLMIEFQSTSCVPLTNITSSSLSSMNEGTIATLANGHDSATSGDQQTTTSQIINSTRIEIPLINHQTAYSVTFVLIAGIAGMIAVVAVGVMYSSRGRGRGRRRRSRLKLNSGLRFRSLRPIASLYLL